MRNKRLMIAAAVLLAMLMLCCAAAAEKTVTVLFTSDIHSWFITGQADRDGEMHEHGGAGRLMTLLQQESNDHTIILDAGDFAMGTLLQAGYTTDAYELRLLGRLGYTATTFGNHEFDSGSAGAASMLRAAMSSGERLPVLLIPANLDLSGTLSADAQSLKDALAAAGSARYIVREVGGVRVAVFGLMGKDAISCAPTSGVTWLDPITAAKQVVAEIGDSADVIICVSHSGTSADFKSGEDVDLIKKVTGIDMVVSGHAHYKTAEAVVVRDGTVIGATGAYLTWLGRVDLKVSDNGTVTAEDYRLIPIDETVTVDAETDAIVDGYFTEIADGYLAGTYAATEVVAHSDFTLSDAIQSQEIPLASLIADSYLYACRNAGYDVDVAIVGMGTVRAPINAGDITAENAFEVCSLGMGGDGSTGHPLVAAWVYGSDLKLAAEMDAFLSAYYSPVVLNYGGMEVTIDAHRAPFDRVTSMQIVHADGTKEPVEMKRLYSVTANMYAINMLGSIQSMTKGLIKLNPLDQNGVKIDSDHYYDYAVTRADGTEVKEWVAFCDYLSSFEKVDGVSQIPDTYRESTGRKTVVYGHFSDMIRNPGTSTLIILGLALLIIFTIVYRIVTRKRRKARKAAKKARRAEKKAARKAKKA